ncbi:hypothetical protein [Nostoc sp.]|uniref:hypothetical protein n=1 Tax=Nostoc sp. TaxID=1180 RepID=UPI002FFA91A6
MKVEKQEKLRAIALPHKTQNAIDYSSLLIIASFNSSTVVWNIFATSLNKSSSWVV